MAAVSPSFPRRSWFKPTVRNTPSDETGAVIRSHHRVSAVQAVAFVVALMLIAIIVASSEPIGLGRSLPQPVKIAAVLAVMFCGICVGIVGVRGLWKKN